jgi:glycosyltransferase involved in cell wall biosynthesis
VKIFKSPAAFPRLAATRADVVHTTIPFVRARQPIIATVQGNFRLESGLYRRGYESLLKRASLVTVPTRQVRDALDIDAPIIPNAVAEEDTAWAPGPSGQDGLRLLVAANYAFQEKTRGFVDLVDALARLARSRNRRSGAFQVTVAGAGPCAQQVETAVARAGPGFTFVGWSRLRDLYARHDILLYNSYLDVQPMLVLEAMMAGMPVIANHVGCIPDLLEPRLVVPDLETLDDTLERLRDPANRAAVSRRNRALAQTHYSWTVVKPQWLKEYGRLAP